MSFYDSEKSYLRNLAAANPDGDFVTKDHVELAQRVLDLGEQFAKLEGDGEKIERALIRLAMQAFESESPKKVSDLKEWSRWFVYSIGQPQLSMPVLSIIEREIGVNKYASGTSPLYPSVLKGYNGVYAPVIDESSGGVTEVGPDAKFIRKLGAEILGLSELVEGIVAPAHNSGRGNKYNIQGSGTYEEHIGSRMGGAIHR